MDLGTNDELTSEPWSVELSVVDDRTRVTVRGELDALTAIDLHNRIGETTEGDVDLDLSEVSFIDSSGLAAIIEGHLRLGVQRRRLVIIGRSAAVQRVLDLSGVTGRLELDPS